MTSPNWNELITLRELSENTGVPYNTLRDFIKRGDLRAYKLTGGKRVMVRRDALDSLVQPIN